MIIKVLGPGCKNCVALTENTKVALSELGMEAEIVKVTFCTNSAVWHHVNAGASR